MTGQAIGRKAQATSCTAILGKPKMRRMDRKSDTAPAEATTDEVRAPKLLDRLREKVRLKHYSIRTEQVYIDWARRFILFHGKRHPKDRVRLKSKRFSRTSQSSATSLHPRRIKRKARFFFCTRKFSASSGRGSTAAERQRHRAGCRSCSRRARRA